MSNWTPDQIPSQAGNSPSLLAQIAVSVITLRLNSRAPARPVLLACRNPQKAQDARTKILASVPHAKLEIAKLNLADLDSIKTFAQAFVAGGRKLDLLINNAGIMSLPVRTPTAQGFEMQFGTNHLGHFALTGELMPALLKTPGSRVVTVASIAHKRAQMRFDDPNWERGYRPGKAYGQTKLANLLFGMELDRRLKRAGADVSSMMAHPGLSVTNIITNGMGKNLKTRWMNFAFSMVAQSDARGAWPSLYAATSPGSEKRALLWSQRTGRDQGLSGRSASQAPGPGRSERRSPLANFRTDDWRRICRRLLVRQKERPRFFTLRSAGQDSCAPVTPLILRLPLLKS